MTSRTLARAASVAVVLAATLSPVAADGPGGTALLCVACGRTAAAELALNAALFVPLGLTAARPGRGLRGAASALAWGFLLSAGVEVAQTLVPGRHPALGDLLANGAGAGLGGLLAVSRGTWLRPPPRAAGRLSAAWGVAAGAVFLTTAVLLRPSLPPSEYWVQHAADLGHLERFPGQVLEARAGDLALPAGRLSLADRRSLVQVLTRGPRLSLRGRFGPPPRGLAPLVSVFDDRQREIVLLGQDGRDLVFRLRRRAADARLHRPGLRAAGLVRPGLEDGVTTVSVRPDTAGGGGAGLCLRAGERRACSLGHGVGRGWSLLAAPLLPPAAARAADGAWIALLMLPLGLWARPRWGWRGGLLAALAGLLAAPALGPVLAAGSVEAVGAASGLLAGLGLARLVRDRDRAGGPG